MTERSLMQLLQSAEVTRLAGAYDGMSAILSERAGFDAIWAGGLGISTAAGVPDAGILSSSDFLAAAIQMKRATSLPVVADIDSGFGDVNVMAHAVRCYAGAGIDAVCVEDKQMPKRNSFRDGNILEEPTVFARKIEAAKKVLSGSDMMVVARIESFNAGETVAEAAERARLYCESGADALLIHSRAEDHSEVARFAEHITGAAAALPLFMIPTTYHRSSARELQQIGADAVVYANQTIRASAKAMEQVLMQIALTDSSASIEAGVASLSEVFELVGTSSLLDDTPWSGLESVNSSRA